MMETGSVIFTVGFALYHMWCIRTANVQIKKIREDHDKKIQQFLELHEQDCHLVNRYRATAEKLLGTIKEIERIHPN